MNANTVWLCLGMIVLGMGGSALYSGLETGSYCLNRVRLQIFKHQGKRTAIILSRLVDNPVLLLGVLLIGNNITNYIGTAGVTVLLESYGLHDWQVVVANILIVTPVLLVFGEVLPKDTFAAYSDVLMYRFARFLRVSECVFKCTGMLMLIRLLAGGKSSGGNSLATLHPRRQVAQLAREGVGSGLLSDEQLAISERVLALNERTVGDEMVPWDSVIKLSSGDTADKVWDLANRSSHARLPVLDTQGQVAGVLRVMDVLQKGRQDCPPVAQVMTRQVTKLDRQTPLRDGLASLQSGRLALAIVTDHGRPVGVVTIKDLIEPITGELASW